MTTHEQARKALSAEMESGMLAYERSPREFAKAVEGFDCAFMPLSEQARWQGFHAPGDLDARIVQDTEAATSAWCIWKLYRTNDAALTGNERNLAKMWERHINRAVELQAEWLRDAGAC